MKRLEHNIETGEIVEIDLADDEIETATNIQKKIADDLKKQAAREKAAAAARQKLADLGLTAAELDALLG